MSKRINIILSDETASVLNRVTSKGTRSTFISRAVLRYIETEGRQNLRRQLAAGYRANTERDLAIAAEWFPLEDEAARKAEASQNSKTKRK
jgi:metal-responsive CopG/Arc/MetJ family transcriptional regulator